MKVMTEELKFADLFPEEAGKLAQRLHLKKEDIPFIRKSYISEKSEIKPEERAVISYISTAAKDRDDEQLLPGGVQLDNYRKNPVVLYGHDYRGLPVGKNIWIKQDDKGLVAKTVFAKSEFADQLYRAYTEDIEGTGPLLKGWSVGFIPRKWTDSKEKDAEDAPKRIFTEWELLEYSAVPIPSCPEALTLACEKNLIPQRLRRDMKNYIEIDPDDPPEDIEVEIEDFQEEIEIENEAQTMTSDELKEHYREIQENQEEVDQKDAEAKRFDLEGNPSVWDIMEAIRLAVQTPQNSRTYRYVSDLYPTKYPDGHVVIEETKEKEKRKYFLHSYEYDDGAIKLGEGKELEATYKPKKGYDGASEVGRLISDIQTDIAELKEGRVLSSKNRKLVKDTIDALSELHTKLEELYAATEPSRAESDNEDDKEIEIVAKKSNDEKQALTDAIREILTEKNVKEIMVKAVEEGVSIEVDKLRGKVR